ncbi:MAG: PIN domain-containing protein [Gemmatimonadetes bacterium]|nr:PIN domain-containing protein [Gemmatimonadota bacterium]MCA9769571.1 PIN domain-containing protein [Gemmatimonadota bacterium]
MASFSVVYDACVLHPAPVRDLLMRIAVSGLVRVRWTEQILDEMIRSIIRSRPDLSVGALDRTRELMCSAVPDCLVHGFERLIPGIHLPDPDDAHVVAAAIRGGAQAIVTFNLKDFPDHDLESWNIEAKHPDEFVMDSIDLAPGVVLQCLIEQAAALRHPSQTVDEVLETLRSAGLVRSASALRDLLRAS